jgi:hypothetical protein
MTAAAVRLAPSLPPPALPPFPSRTVLAMEQMTMQQLERIFVRGQTPDLDMLVGWEWRGINRLRFNRVPIAEVAGIKKFVKGFYRAEDGRVMGYNIGVARNALDGRWNLLPSDTDPRRFGFFGVAPVDATARDNTYLHAILLDYSKGGNARLDVSNGLRDYVVQVDPSNPDLFLGKAYYALGPLRFATNFFILERHRRGLTEYVRR